MEKFGKRRRLTYIATALIEHQLALVEDWREDQRSNLPLQYWWRVVTTQRVPGRLVFF